MYFCIHVYNSSLFSGSEMSLKTEIVSRSPSVQGGSHHDEIKFVTTTKLDRFNVGDVLAKTTFFT